MQDLVAENESLKMQVATLSDRIRQASEILRDTTYKNRMNSINNAAVLLTCEGCDGGDDFLGKLWASHGDTCEAREAAKYLLDFIDRGTIPLITQTLARNWPWLLEKEEK